MFDAMVQRVTQADIADMLEAFERSDFARLELIFGSARLTVDRSPPEPPPAEELSQATPVIAPLLGFFQTGPEAGAPAFVRSGSKVQADTTIGLIRVMNELTPVKAGLRGTVSDICVQDGQLVEYGQALLQVMTESDRGAGADREHAR